MAENKYTEEVLNIFRTSKVQKRFWDKVDKSNQEGCWEWKGAKSPKGYGSFTLSTHAVYAPHVLSLWSHLNEAPTGRFCCHKCDNPSCVRPDHLWFGTASENTQDALTKGRIVRDKGELHRDCTITEEKALEVIKARKETGKGVRDLHKMFPDVSRSTIKGIIYNQSWNHLAR